MDIQKAGVIVFFLFLFLPFTSANDDDFQYIENGISINYKDQIHINKNQNYDLHIHALNSSPGGGLLDNSTTFCGLHLYNSTGNHILVATMSYSIGDFGYDIPNTTFSEEGWYVYTIGCFNDDGNGLISGHFLATNAGYSDPKILVADIFMICLIVFFFTMVIKRFGDVDFEAMDKRIVEKHDGNWMKSFARSFGYGLMKNAFLWYYLAGWFLLFFIKDLTYRFTPEELYGYMILIFDIYSFGFILVIVFFIGMIYKHFENIRELIDDISRGVN